MLKGAAVSSASLQCRKTTALVSPVGVCPDSVLLMSLPKALVPQCGHKTAWLHTMCKATRPLLLKACVSDWLGKHSSFTMSVIL